MSEAQVYSGCGSHVAIERYPYARPRAHRSQPYGGGGSPTASRWPVSSACERIVQRSADQQNAARQQNDQFLPPVQNLTTTFELSHRASFDDIETYSDIDQSRGFYAYVESPELSDRFVYCVDFTRRCGSGCRLYSRRAASGRNCSSAQRSASTLQHANVAFEYTCLSQVSFQSDYRGNGNVRWCTLITCYAGGQQTVAEALIFRRSPERSKGRGSNQIFSKPCRSTKERGRMRIFPNTIRRSGKVQSVLRAGRCRRDIHLCAVSRPAYACGDE